MNQHQLPSDIVGLAKVMPPLSRRSFMSSSAADAKVPVTGGDMPVYYARPSGAQRPPIILVCQEIFGIHEWVSDVTRRLGHAGAFAVAPDYYFRLGDIAKLNCSPIWTQQWPGQNRKAAMPTGLASSGSAAVVAMCG